MGCFVINNYRLDVSVWKFAIRLALKAASAHMASSSLAPREESGTPMPSGSGYFAVGEITVCSLLGTVAGLRAEVYAVHGSVKELSTEVQRLSHTLE